MSSPGVLVIEETPSLASAIEDLLRSDGIPVEAVAESQHGLRAYTAQTGRRPRVIVCASNTHRCETARRWFRGEFTAEELVVVGSRDPGLQSGGHLHVVSLPLTPTKFLDLIHSLVGEAGVATPPPSLSGT